jgi:hypothetical protein
MIRDPFQAAIEDRRPASLPNNLPPLASLHAAWTSRHRSRCCCIGSGTRSLNSLFLACPELAIALVPGTAWFGDSILNYVFDGPVGAALDVNPRLDPGDRSCASLTALMAMDHAEARSSHLPS